MRRNKYDNDDDDDDSSGSSNDYFKDDLDDQNKKNNRKKNNKNNKYTPPTYDSHYVKYIPFVNNIPVPVNPIPKLVLSVILDFLGFFTQIIPVFGIAMWPTISSFLIYRMYGSSLGTMVSFVEETIPGLGFIPTATVCWLDERYNLVDYCERYIPMFKYVGGIRKTLNSIYKLVKYITYSVIAFIAYKLLSYFVPSSSQYHSSPSNYSREEEEEEEEEMQYDENVVNAMLMCIISGLSTAIGGLFILFMKSPSYKFLGYMLGFSSGVMIYISFMDLLPESAAEIGFLPANGFFFAGIIFFALVLKLVPEADEHEHGPSEETHEHSSVESSNTTTHTNSSSTTSTVVKRKNGADKTPPQSPPSSATTKQQQQSKQTKKPKEKKKQMSDAYLKNLGVVTALGISLHNFPEGVAVYLSCLKSMQVGLPLMLAIAAHNIPEGMAVAAPIYTATGSKWVAFKYCLLSGLCEPFGAIIFGFFFRDYMTPYLVQAMLAAVAGIMIFMAIKELIPATLKYIDVNGATISNFVGMFVIFLSIYYLHGMLPHDLSEGDGGHGHSHGGGAHSHSHSHGGGAHSHGHSHGGASGHSHAQQQSSVNAW
ncbi:zinc/iron permease [Cavenderia fasciculata]|uniref:Zinc/iron permease n=1 Tax=Cavenderia fasciculata TaxID=261658 RepID=F4PWQ0_CACFS|nr:zinc/iron permease [Cavenderia fasciculata]EGG20414.1 zinc/iron permease [Cavenderia fasciculata]|eukprot:XP_004367397.1 zinc/iron permease [Cavenderia fasciculata]